MQRGDDETARLLADVEVFSGLEERELEQVAQVAVPRTFERGEVIFREGDAGITSPRSKVRGTATWATCSSSRSSRPEKTSTSARSRAVS